MKMEIWYKFIPIQYKLQDIFVIIIFNTQYVSMTFIFQQF